MNARRQRRVDAMWDNLLAFQAAAQEYLDRRSRESKKVDKIAPSMRRALANIEDAFAAMNAKDWIEFGYKYGEAITAFREPATKAGFVSIRATMTGGKHRAKPTEAAELAREFLASRLSSKSAFVKHRNANISAGGKKLKVDTGRRMIARGLTALEKQK